MGLRLMNVLKEGTFLMYLKEGKKKKEERRMRRKVDSVHSQWSLQKWMNIVKVRITITNVQQLSGRRPPKRDREKGEWWSQQQKNEW